MMIWQFQDHDKCPRCVNKETNIHIFKYQNKEAKETWKYTLGKLKEAMELIYTDPKIIQTIIDALEKFIKEKPTIKMKKNYQKSIHPAEEYRVGCFLVWICGTRVG